MPISLAVAAPGAMPSGTSVGQALEGREYGVSDVAAPIPGSSGEIPFEELTCTMQKLDGSGPCNAPRIHGDDVCVGHKRAREKRQKKGI